MDTEKLRRRYRPDHIRVLFIGESPPAGGTFFYARDSRLFRATRQAFECGIPELLTRADFLENFRALGCYLDDLCLTPVNHLRGTPELERQREFERLRGEDPLATRMREDPPQAVAVTMKGIVGNIQAALRTAGLADLPMKALPFPGRPQHAATYVQELASYLRDLHMQALM